MCSSDLVAAEYLSAMEKCGVDCYQVGARNMQNFELLKRLGKLKKPVILKRGISGQHAAGVYRRRKAVNSRKIYICALQTPQESAIIGVKSAAEQGRRTFKERGVSYV